MLNAQLVGGREGERGNISYLAHIGGCDRKILLIKKKHGFQRLLLGNVAVVTAVLWFTTDLFKIVCQRFWHTESPNCFPNSEEREGAQILGL